MFKDFTACRVIRYYRIDCLEAAKQLEVYTTKKT